MVPVPEQFKTVPTTREGRITYLLDMNLAAIQASLPNGIDFSKRLVDKSDALQFARNAHLQWFETKEFFGMPVDIRFYKRRGHCFSIVIVDEQAVIVEYQTPHRENRLKAHRR